MKYLVFCFNHLGVVMFTLWQFMTPLRIFSLSLIFLAASSLAGCLSEEPVVWDVIVEMIALT